MERMARTPIEWKGRDGSLDGPRRPFQAGFLPFTHRMHIVNGRIAQCVEEGAFHGAGAMGAPKPMG